MQLSETIKLYMSKTEYQLVKDTMTEYINTVNGLVISCILEDLPPVTPSDEEMAMQYQRGYIDGFMEGKATFEPKTGHWFIDERPESDREVVCSNCDQPIFKFHIINFDYRPKYCPNCGARMVKEQESENK